MATTFRIERASTGRAACKFSGCKANIAKDDLRVAKVSPSPFDADAEIAAWYGGVFCACCMWVCVALFHVPAMLRRFHLPCIFKAQQRARAWRIEAASQLMGYLDLTPADQAVVDAALQDALEAAPAASTAKKPAESAAAKAVAAPPPPSSLAAFLFCDFCGLCEAIADEASLTVKSTLVNRALVEVRAGGVTEEQHGRRAEPSCHGVMRAGRRGPRPGVHEAAAARRRPARVQHAGEVHLPRV
jgi:hypothetical protein